jgi:AAA+ ATPase superfamily predicted ATPase
MFLGRKKELQTLKSLYEKEGMSFVVIYGRRRVGKTALINEFCKDKKSINYMGP